MSILLCCGAAWAKFGQPFTISPPGIHAATPLVAVDLNGNAVFAWTDNVFPGKVQARTLSAAGILGPVRTLGTGYARDIQIDNSGRAIVLWETSSPSVVQARAISQSGALGPARTIGKDVSLPLMGMDGDGNAIFVVQKQADFSDKPSILQLRRLSAGGTLGSIEEIFRIVTNTGFRTAIAVAANGNAIVGWFEGSPEVLLRARTLSTTGGIGGVQVIASDRALESRELYAGIDLSGNAVFNWCRDDRGKYHGFARRLSSAGALGPLERLTKTASSVDNCSFAMGGDGNAIAGWRRSTATENLVQARFLFGANDAIGNLETLTRSGDFPFPVAVDQHGNAVFTWLTFDSSGNRLHARTLATTGEIGKIQTLTPADTFLDLTFGNEPTASVSPFGKAIVVWILANGEMQGSIGP